MGPFQWPVWVAITAIYLLAIFPLGEYFTLGDMHKLGNIRVAISSVLGQINTGPFDWELE